MNAPAAWNITLPAFFIVRGKNYDIVSIERRALQSEAMGLCFGAACKLSLWNERLGKMPASSQAPEKALKLLVSVLSLLRARPSIDTVS